MSRQSVLLAALSSEPVSTDALYARIGYPALVSLGLVPYHAFRAELEKLCAEGVAQSAPDADGATTWRLAGDS